MAEKFKACSIDGCNRNAHHTKRGVRNMCNVHYGRWLRHGDPLEGRTPEGDPMRFFIEKVVNFQGSECFYWPYAKDNHGYAKIYINGEMELVSRYVCSTVHGAPPTPDHVAAHSCGNGHLACVSPNHMRWATREENELDKISHGTEITGGLSFLPKLDIETAKAIKTAVGSHRSIAKTFGVSHTMVGAIRRGEKWPDA